MIIDYAPFWLALATYVVATASPGPATLAIMATAAEAGRKTGLVFAAGIVTGSVMWGLGAAFGLTAVLTGLPDLFLLLRIAGGFYLLWLACKSVLALRRGLAPAAGQGPSSSSYKTIYQRGLALHLTNPKGLLGWTATIAVGVPVGSGAGQVAGVLIACFALGILIFGGYAILFSRPAVRRVYRAAFRPVQLFLALLFGAAGVKLITDARL